MLSSREVVNIVLDKSKPLEERAFTALDDAVNNPDEEDRVPLRSIYGESFIRRLGVLLDTTMGETLTLIKLWEQKRHQIRTTISRR